MPEKTSLSDLFHTLSRILKDFSNDIKAAVSRDNEEASSKEIREVIGHIKEKINKGADSDEKEDKAILKLLNQLVVDKEIISLVEIESEEWLEFIELIEERLGSNMEGLSNGERESYRKMLALSSELKSSLRKS